LVESRRRSIDPKKGPEIKETAMKLRLYSLAEPSGRSLLLAHKLHQVAGMGGSESLQTAERLFAFHHPIDKPVVVEVSGTSAAEDLKATCAPLGILVETVIEEAVCQERG
jgi:hypothetical protein